MMWLMPGRRTTDSSAVSLPSGRRSVSIFSGRGMSTVPRKHPSSGVIEHSTSAGAPEIFSARRQVCPMGARRHSHAPKLIVALPQNSPPIICRRICPSATVSTKPTCSASGSRSSRSDASSGCSARETGVVTSTVIFVVWSASRY